MKIVLAGAGRIGTMHGRVLAQLVDPSDIVVTDPAPDRARALADELGGTVAATPDQALRGGADGLVIATNTQTHAELIRSGCAASVPTFCEKPVTMDVPSTREVQKFVEYNGTQVQIGFQRRFDPGYVEARRRVRSGELGELRRAHLVSADPASPPIDFIATSGGIFRDLLIHDLDILPWVAGSPIASISALGAARTPDFAEVGDVDEVVAMLSLEDGTVATLHGSRRNGAGYDVRMEAAGTLSTVVVGLAPESPLSRPSRTSDRRASSRGRTSPIASRPPTAEEMVAFLEMVTTGGSSPAPSVRPSTPPWRPKPRTCRCRRTVRCTWMRSDATSGWSGRSRPRHVRTRDTDRGHS